MRQLQTSHFLIAVAAMTTALTGWAESHTYELPATEIFNAEGLLDLNGQALPSGATTDHTTHQLTYGGIEWTVSIDWHKYDRTTGDTDIHYIGSDNKNVPNCVIATNLTLSSSSFEGRSISEINGTYKVGSTYDEKQAAIISGTTYNVSTSIGNTFAQTSDVIKKSTENAVNHTYDSSVEVTSGEEVKISIDMTTGYYGKIFTPTITITYEGELPALPATSAPELSFIETAQLSHEAEDATIYYAFDDDTEYTTYEDSIDITNKPSGTVLRYYASEPLMSDSEVKTVKLSDVSTLKPITFSEVVALYDEITLSGYVIEQGEGYTLVGETVNSTADEAIAVDNSKFSALARCAAGTAVTCSGYYSNTFGRASLTSLTSATAYEYGATTELTSITAVGADDALPTFDLSGRRAAATTPGIYVTRGSKFLRR